MSARTPRRRPDMGSTTLNVCRSRSCPVPVRSESTYSTSGGCTSWNPCARKWSSSARRSASIRSASGGRMSSMYSGRIHLRMAYEPVTRESQDDRDKADEAQLSIGQEDKLLKAVAPYLRRDEREEPLDDEHQRKRSPQRVGHESIVGKP